MPRSLIDPDALRLALRRLNRGNLLLIAERALDLVPSSMGRLSVELRVPRHLIFSRPQLFLRNDSWDVALDTALAVVVKSKRWRALTYAGFAPAFRPWTQTALVLNVALRKGR